jgi:SAM-dependent methyltransferase
MLNLVRRVVPRTLRRALSRYRETHKKARLFGPLAPLIPPVEAMFDGPASLDEFKANGIEFLQIYKDLCGIEPTEQMLDVGCGIGRKTVPLTGYLTGAARYEGIDANAFGVDWCSRNITPRFPNFHFQWVDVSNRLYNPAGAQSPSTFRFPFPDGSFTFVTLGSVFTHMLPDDVKQYLSEVYRVLGRGRCLISYFLLNDSARRLIGAGKSSLKFVATNDGYSTISPETPEDAIAFEEGFITSLYQQAGLRIERLEYGSWCGRENSLSYQDLVLATKA